MIVIIKAEKNFFNLDMLTTYLYYDQKHHDNLILEWMSIVLYKKFIFLELNVFTHYFGGSRVFQYEILSEARKKLKANSSIYEKDIEMDEKKKSGEGEKWGC